VDVDRQSTTYEKRLFKYAKRGFKIAVPGYRKEAQVSLFRAHRFSVSDVTGLLKLLYMQFYYTTTNKSHPSKQKALTNIYGETCLVERDVFVDSADELALIKKKDYIEIRVPFEYSAAQSYETMKRHLRFYRSQMEKKHDNYFWIPPYSFYFNTIPTDGPVHKWKTLNPGTQMVGSFNPTDKNFYEDVYKQQLTYRAIWRKVIINTTPPTRTVVPYDKYISEKLERQFLGWRGGSTISVDISENYRVIFKPDGTAEEEDKQTGATVRVEGINEVDY
jgi:hypothetical protein